MDPIKILSTKNLVFMKQTWLNILNKDINLTA